LPRRWQPAPGTTIAGMIVASAGGSALTHSTSGTVHFRDHREDRYRRGRGHRRDWHGGWWRYPQPHGWRPGWPYRWDSRRHRRWAHGPLADWRRRDNGSFITGALIGSTLTHSALHERGDHRYCDHDRGRYDGGTRCYRVQLLPGGMERRVPLPNTACF
jgi:hypothetical protein